MRGTWLLSAATRGARAAGDVDYLYGVASVKAALSAHHRSPLELFLSGTDKLQRRDLANIYQMARMQGLPVHFCGKKGVEKLVPTGAPHQHVVLRCSALAVAADEARLLVDIRTSKESLWLVLDSIQDPMNFGAMLRSAVFFGVDRVVLTGLHCPPTPTVSRVSSGALEGIPLWRTQSLAILAQTAVACDWTVFGTLAPLTHAHPKLMTQWQLIGRQDTKRMLVGCPLAMFRSTGIEWKSGRTPGMDLGTSYESLGRVLAHDTDPVLGFHQVMGNEHSGLKRSDLDHMSAWVTIEDRIKPKLRALGLESLNVGVGGVRFLFFSLLPLSPAGQPAG